MSPSSLCSLLKITVISVSSCSTLGSLSSTLESAILFVGGLAGGKKAIMFAENQALKSLTINCL